jgi:hypothetical protein
MWTNALKTSWTRWIPPVIFCSFLASCGKEGSPHPPLPRLPKALAPALVQVGGMLEVRADLPSAFLDGVPMPQWRSIEIYLLRMPSQEDKLPPAPPPASFYNRKNLLLNLPQEEARARTEGGRLHLQFPLKELRIPEDKTSAAFWGFIVVGPRGQRGLPSDILPFMVMPPLPPVQDLKGISEAEGARLTFTPPEKAEKVRVARSVEAGLPTALEDLKQGSTMFLDQRVKSGAFYTYFVTCLGKDDAHQSPPARWDITYADTFPPGPPDQVAYLPMEGKAWLKFAPGSGATRYRIYRQCPGGEWEQVLETTELLVEVPATPCDYAVASADEAGNVSEKVGAVKEQP